jgi:FMN phosphatase YigB (HAD superfamily)
MLARFCKKKRLGVVSNFFIPFLPAQYLEFFGLAQYFDFILDSADFGFKKPDPRIFSRALELAGLTIQQADRVLFIGDRLALDFFPAKALGMQSLHFNRSRDRPSTAVSQPGVTAIYHWDELLASPAYKGSAGIILDQFLPA